MSTVPMKQLPSGALMPAVGMGTYKIGEEDDGYDAVREALRLGYRHLDTAKLYETEEAVGRAVRDAGVARSEIFITSKVPGKNYGYESTMAAVRESNEALGLEYIDLYLMHTPGESSKRGETWRALEDLQKEGIVKDIGVSNFGVDHLKKLSETWQVKPAVNQIEYHPWLRRDDIVNYCQEHGIFVEAFCPLARTQKLKDEILNQVAVQIKATPAQTLIAWCLAKGVIPLPKSSNPQRLAENLEGARFVADLTPKMVATLDELNEGYFAASDLVNEYAP